ncbi:MAG: FkbM family methyltransferase [Infirmifilum sp.]
MLEVAKRFARRFFLWLRFVRSFRSLTLKSQVNLLLSALIDLLMSLVVKPHNPRLLFSGLYVSSDGFTVFARGGTEDLYYLLPGREGPVDRFIRAVLRPGDFFVDVGANVGYYTLVAAKKGCRVVAVEPVLSTVAVLKLNLRLNGLEDRVKVVEGCAISRSERRRIYVPRGRWFGLASLYASGVGGEEFVVDCIALDDILRGVPKVRLVKVDVEGAELEVLQGMRDTLPRICCIVIELSKGAGEVISLLKSFGFSVRPLGFTTYVVAFRANS